MDAIMLHTSELWDVNRQSRFPAPTSRGYLQGEAAWWEIKSIKRFA
jgi:hypothetical protein